MKESAGNKYLTDVENAVADDSYALLKIFEPCTKALEALEAADISPEAKYRATKRMKRFIQDVWDAIPNQYVAAVEHTVHSVMFPEDTPPLPGEEFKPSEVPALEIETPKEPPAL